MVHPGEMWRKTAVIAGSKYMPKSSESERVCQGAGYEVEKDFVMPLFEDEKAALPAPEAIPPRPTRESIKAEKAAAERHEERAGTERCASAWACQQVRNQMAEPTMKWGPGTLTMLEQAVAKLNLRISDLTMMESPPGIVMTLRPKDLPTTRKMLRDTLNQSPSTGPNSRK